MKRNPTPAGHLAHIRSQMETGRVFSGGAPLPDHFLTIPQAAELLGLSKQRVWVLVKNGQLTAERVGRTWLVLRESVEQRQSGKEVRP